MRKLLNTLYVTSPDSYLALDGENIVVLQEEQETRRVPLHNLESVVAFSYTGASPALMGACAKRGISLCFMTDSGRFLARVTGEERGNVLLRKRQYRVSDEEGLSLEVARMLLTGKLYNSKSVLDRARRDHALRLDTERLGKAGEVLRGGIGALKACETLESLRGVEGDAAAAYFAVFDDLILQQKEDFRFDGRSRRPPMDRVNALLSFVYTLLANDTAAALETVGLDPYVGFLHRDRPGRASLALDMMEEFRAVVADRFVLSLINRREVAAGGFTIRENGSVAMDDDARKTVLQSWQEKKRESITHPFLEEKMSWGLVPYVQSMLLARYLRGDLDAYPPFLWK